MTAPRWQDAQPDWNGLALRKAWNVAAGPQWQARLDRAGRAHVIGLALAEHPEYGPRYADPWRSDASKGNALFRMVRAGTPPPWYVHRQKLGHPGWARPRPWHTFARANRAASYHERLWLAAKRAEAQAGQGGE